MLKKFLIFTIIGIQTIHAGDSVTTKSNTNGEHTHLLPCTTPDISYKMQIAIEDDNTAAILEILKNNPSLLKDEGEKLLQQAVQTLSVKATHILLNKGANPQALIPNGDTLLHAIASHDFSEKTATRAKKVTQITRRLIKAGLLVTAYAKLGYHPIHTAAAQHNYPALQVLVTKGADVNASTIKNNTATGITPLHMITSKLCTSGTPAHKETLQMLLNAGADITAQDTNKRTPLDYAIEADNKTAQTILQKHADLAKLAKELVESLKIAAGRA